MSDITQKTYLPGPQTARRYGISDRSLSRWEASLDLNFPQALIVNGRKFFAVDELEAWERARAASSNRKAA